MLALDEDMAGAKKVGKRNAETSLRLARSADRVAESDDA